MRSKWMFGCLSAVAFVVSTSARGAVVLEKLVADGDVEPVTGLTYKLHSSGHSGNAGRVLLDVTLSGAGVTTGNDRALLYGNIAAPRLLVREGDALPGHAAGEKVVAAQGSVGPTGWYGLRIGGSTSEKFAAVIGDGVTASIVARTGDLAPGTGGNTMHTAWVENVASATRYTLMSYLPKPSGATSYPTAYYRTMSDSALQLMALSTTNMPQLLPENRSILINQSVHAGAYSMWTLSYEAPTNPYGSSRRALFMSRDSGHRLVVNETDPQPVNPPAGAAAPRALWLDENGDYVFASGFHDVATNYYYGVGLYTGSPTSYALRRLPSEVFVDQPGYRAESIHVHRSNDVGRVAFTGQLSDRATAQELIDVLAIGDIERGFSTIARDGDLPAGAAAGQSFTRFGNSSSGGLWMNDDGDVMFLGWLGGTGVGTTNDSALWLYDDQSQITALLAREGETLLINGATRTIGSLEYTRAFFDQSGEPILELGFTDNTRGFFAAHVPEPSGALVVAAAGALLTRRTRQRGR